jgi:hypothetical protein
MAEDFPDLAAAAAAIAAAAAAVFTVSAKDSIYSHVAKAYPVTNGHLLSPGPSNPELSPSNSKV